MKEITLTITIEEANLLLESLGQQPFNRVYELIQKIQQQAASQLQEGEQAVSPKSSSK